jgi:phosphoribosylformylglycinamidine cyclo-ligase
MAITYKDAGVDIDAGHEVIKKIAPLVKETHNEKVLSNIGLFGGFYEADFEGYKRPVLVGSTDGVGTKLKVAFMTGMHDTIGQCLVNHCVDDILCCGAKPLFFLDYFGTGKLEPDTAAEVIKGFAVACKENGTALIGGETAEMPSIYADGEYDVSGTIVGVVDKDKAVNGQNIKEGDQLIALPSTGLHTNGYSLARKVLFEKYDVNQHVDELGETVGEALLKVHKSYMNGVLPLVDKKMLNGISHITGGGIVGNTSRIMPEGRELVIEWDKIKELPIFDLIRKEGEVPEEDMRRTFNLGVGMILVASKEKADEVFNAVSMYDPYYLGEIK